VAVIMLLLEFNLVLLVLTTFVVYPFSVYYYRHYTGRDLRKWLHILGEMLLIIATGLWFPILTTIFFTIIVSRVVGYLMFKNGVAGGAGRRDLGTGQLIRAGLFRFLLALLTAAVITFYGVVVVGRVIGQDWLYILSFATGTGISIAWAARKGIPFYNKNPDMCLRSKATIVVVLSITCISVVSLVMSPVNHPIIADGVEIKTMSFNILYSGEDGTLQEWPDRRAPLSNYIESLDLDVFGLQEVFKIQGDYINATLDNRNYTWVGIGRELPDGNRTGEHDAIFFDTDRFDLLDNGTRWFSDTPTVPSRSWLTETIKRTYQWVHLREKTTGVEFYFYNTHFGFYPEFHIRASIQLNSDITARTGNLPVIVTGDFNMPPLFPFYSFLEGFGTKPIYDAARMKAGYADLMKIDYIFVTADIHVREMAVRGEANEGSQWLSDHDPVVMACTMPRS
jgi:endonuclease/exonuclease/phosphatase family metal-dependent hydrolase